MNVRIVCIGKIKDNFYKDAVAEYAKRLMRFCKFEIVELSEKLLAGKNEADIAVVKEDEGKRIINALKGYVFALDMRGKQFTSEEFSKKLQDIQMSDSTVTFVIGGSYGLSEKVLSEANTVMSFGKITFPHQLMRVVLTEQIYRAFTIAEGSGYHK